jgi:hypothetical protein
MSTDPLEDALARAQYLAWARIRVEEVVHLLQRELEPLAPRIRCALCTEDRDELRTSALTELVVDDERTIAFDYVLSPSGWQMEVFARDGADRGARQWLELHGAAFREAPTADGRDVLADFERPLDAAPEDIAKALMILFHSALAAVVHGESGDR